MIRPVTELAPFTGQTCSTPGGIETVIRLDRPWPRLPYERAQRPEASRR